MHSATSLLSNSQYYTYHPHGLTSIAEFNGKRFLRYVHIVRKQPSRRGTLTLEYFGVRYTVPLLKHRNRYQIYLLKSPW